MQNLESSFYKILIKCKYVLNSKLSLLFIDNSQKKSIFHVTRDYIAKLEHFKENYFFKVDEVPYCSLFHMLSYIHSFPFFSIMVEVAKNSFKLSLTDHFFKLVS